MYLASVVFAWFTYYMHLLQQEGPLLKSKGKASSATRIAVLTWRSLLIMSREWKYFWLRLVLCMLFTLCVGTVFSGLGHSLSSVVVSCKFWHFCHYKKFFLIDIITKSLSMKGMYLLCAHVNQTYSCLNIHSYHFLNFLTPPDSNEHLAYDVVMWGWVHHDYHVVVLLLLGQWY